MALEKAKAAEQWLPALEQDGSGWGLGVGWGASPTIDPLGFTAPSIFDPFLYG
jgi:hypothetical protein